MGIVSGSTGTTVTVNNAANGTLILNGANTYTGATTVSAGQLQLGNGTVNNSLGGTSSLTVSGGGTDPQRTQWNDLCR